MYASSWPRSTRMYGLPWIAPSRYSSFPALMPLTMKSESTPYSLRAVTSLRVAPLRVHSPYSAMSPPLISAPRWRADAAYAHWTVVGGATSGLQVDARIGPAGGVLLVRLKCDRGPGLVRRRRRPRRQARREGRLLVPTCDPAAVDSAHPDLAGRSLRPSRTA